MAGEHTMMRAGSPAAGAETAGVEPAGRGTSGAAVVVAVVGAKGAPGATTSAVALALQWPHPVLLVDADPGGGDLAAGWLGGRVGLERGLLSFAAATRHIDIPGAAELAAHVVGVPDAPQVLVLPGLAHAGQAGGLQPRVWTRLLAAATAPWPPADPTADPAVEPAADQGGEGAVGVRVDVLADCGRIGPATPWPLLASAGVVLLATRPTLRGVHHARHARSALTAGIGDKRRVRLLVCGAGPYEPAEVGRAVGLEVAVTLPADAAAAQVLSDGASPGRGWPRTLLTRAAQTAARLVAAAAKPPANADTPPSWEPTGSVRDVRPATGGASR